MRFLFPSVAVGSLPARAILVLAVVSVIASPAIGQVPRDREDPAILALLESNPTTPEQLVRAAGTALDLGRPDVSRSFLAKLLALMPDENTSAALQRGFGSGTFIRFSRFEALKPEGEQVAKVVIDGAYNAGRNPQRLARLIDQLRDPSPVVRRSAALDLREGGSAAVAALAGALADSGRAGQHEAVREALVAMEEAAIEPLIGALESTDAALQAQVIEVLGRLKARRAVPFVIEPALGSDVPSDVKQAAQRAVAEIVGRLPTEYDGKSYLARQARRYYDGEPVLPAAADGQVEIWHWDAAASLPVARRYPSHDASLAQAARLAAALAKLEPDNAAYRRLAVATLLERAKLAGGLDQPLAKGPATSHAAAVAAGAETVDAVLAETLQGDHVAAAIAAAEVLGDLGRVDVLLDPRGQPRALAAALRHGDRRVRAAAAAAILKIDPRQPYPGSSHLVETLGRQARSGGTRKAVVADPRGAHVQRLVGFLAEMGIEARPATSGRRLFEAAAGTSDLEFVIVSDVIDDPPLTDLLDDLRRDPRTSRLPVGISTEPENFDRVVRRAEDVPLTAAFPPPYDRAAMEYNVRRLMAGIGRDHVTAEERLAHARAALAALATLAENAQRYPFYELLRLEGDLLDALHQPATTDEAARVLGLIGSPAAQRGLVELASQNAQPLETRQSALAGFATAVARRGILLTRLEILRQYDRYNQSAELEESTQAVLGGILDAIESRRKGDEVNEVAQP